MKSFEYSALGMHKRSEDLQTVFKALNHFEKAFDIDIHYVIYPFLTNFAVGANHIP